MRPRVLLGMALLATAAWATPIAYIDPFSTTYQWCQATPASTLCNDMAPAPEAVGGSRQIILNSVVGNVSGGVSPWNGLLAFSQELGSTGMMGVLWNSVGDITNGGAATQFEISAHSSLGMSGSFVISAPGSGGPVPFYIPPAAPGVFTAVTVPFSSFAGDLTNVSTIALILDGLSRPESVAGIDYIAVSAASIPEPASLLLIGGGLVGLNLLRRRIRRA